MSRQELRAASEKIHGILVESLKIQVYCFGQPGFIGAIKRLFQKMDFGAASKRLENHINELDFYIAEIQPGTIETMQEKEYALLLIEYAESLKTAIRKMDDIVRALVHKAGGGKLSYGEYDNLINELKVAQYICNQTGNKLTEKYCELIKN